MGSKKYQKKLWRRERERERIKKKKKIERSAVGVKEKLQSSKIFLGK